MKKQIAKKEFDLVIQFNAESYIDIKTIPVFDEIADWKKYGTVGFRGFCLLNEEETEKIIINVLKLDSSDFKVFKTTGFFIPH